MLLIIAIYFGHWPTRACDRYNNSRSNPLVREKTTRAIRISGKMSLLLLALAILILIIGFVPSALARHALASYVRLLTSYFVRKIKCIYLERYA